jgi:hypothetical protein
VDQERTDAYYVNKDKDDGSGFATSVEALAIADVNIAIAAGNAAYYTTATGGSIQYANANALLVSNENSARIICATDVSQACNGIPAVSLPGLPWNALP